MLPPPYTPQERLYVWRVGYPVLRALALFLMPVRLEGVERIPPGGVILVANHISWKDPPWLTFALDRAVRFMGKEELFRVPILGGVLRLSGNFGVRRGEADRRALVTALRVVQAGLPLGFFPEGHRSESGAMIRAHPGVALVARRAGVPIVPVGVIGSKRARIGAFWRRDVLFRIGEPFDPKELPQGDEQAAADEIMRHVAALLPSEMRGVYGTPTK
ncbi:MAG TPA: lysophospholipid acyltransferase family protein [Candidatus Acidoferrales bacterium]|nr:lysophospholipid acyltransferase family protein [Candidatus Acidoferrales bacterium]